MKLAWVEESGGATCAEILATVLHWFGVAGANGEYRRVADRYPTFVGDALRDATGPPSYADR